ncbi:acyl-CoA dehydrogenase [Pseudomonas aeruginosa]|uniref:acyl-CoA dehydrogenase family protein n=1 Tax=Pseudomonas aeruginosa TaxID=287 RepID=UPI000FFF60DB|nr:acyl-CoA dehydrogenase family protein [Pseudomonas aeruginosa]MBG4604167.1 acyl-CoA dehydrogenase family protein [Pseudomonas aeruginosa]MBH8257458.1 acyl-CoA dehydrogenase family protein [Pseudomonas aeruginosa]MCV3907765.1 acyl-CoA dehydrogenase family protein [Pseudomonas aeruginosa]NPS39673.1 acyl-CoA dehydrogenase [Pseudomonas aeruginosa]NPS89145.1 acyl-CoA dehydrogenase [Pseudomonas aeruginosa]
MNSPIRAEAPVNSAAAERAKTLRAYAASLVPTLKARAAETARLGRLPDETIADLEAGGLLSMTTPRKYGGEPVSTRTYLEVVAELGRGDASVAWVASLINVTTWAAATTFGQAASDEVFGGAEPARVVGVLSPRKAQVKKVEGGYLIEEGMWGFNSGIHHANWDLLGIPLVNDDGVVIDQGCALIRRSDVTVLNDWNVIGISGSGSCSVTVSNVFVPESRITTVSKAIAGDYPSVHLADEPLFRASFMPMLSLVLTFPALGLAAAAVETFLEALPRRGIQYTWYTKQAEAPVTHLQVGEATAKIDAARAILERHADTIDTCAASGQPMDYLERARVRRDVGFAEKLIWEAVDLLATASGGSLAAVGNPFTRLWQDARVASLHGIVSPATNFETFGRLLCGNEAGTPFI